MPRSLSLLERLGGITKDKPKASSEPQRLSRPVDITKSETEKKPTYTADPYVVKDGQNY